MIKILHTADLHIGANFSAFNEKIAEKIAKLQLLAIIDMVKVANSNFADILLIAGDLFDSHTVSVTLKTKIIDLLSHFNGQIFIVCGNHDYYFKDSFWDKVAFPNNFTLFTENTFVKYESVEICVHGASFNDTYDSLDLATLSVNPQKLNIALAHSDLLTKSKYNSYTRSEIGATGLDYFAFGHNHAFSEIQSANGTFYASCGCISATGKDEIGAHGFIICELTKESKNFTFHKSKGAIILEQSIDISRINTELELVEEISKLAGEEVYLDLTLDGIKNIEIDTKTLKNQFDEKFMFLEIFDNSTSSDSLWKYIDDQSLIGEFTRNMKIKYQENPSSKVLDALKIGLDSLLN